MVKFKYSATERAIVYGSFLVAKDSQVVADLYHGMFGWSLDRRTVERIFEIRKTHIFENLSGAGRPSKVDETEIEMLIVTLGEDHQNLQTAAYRIYEGTNKNVNSRTLGPWASILKANNRTEPEFLR